jgi:histone arginine demethylase JMJD6
MPNALEEFPVDVAPTPLEEVTEDSFEEFTPMVIRGALDRARARWTDDWLLERFGDDYCQISMDSRTARRTFATQMALPAYLDTLRSSDAGSQGYLFHSQRDFEGAQDLLDDLDVPEPILDLGVPSLYRFYVGPALTGTLPHFHTYAINALARGRKRWAVYVGPNPQVNRSLVEDSLAQYAGGSQASDWFEAECPVLRDRPRIRLWEFVQEAGDLVYIPRGFIHAVVNLDQVVGFTVEFGPGDQPGPKAAAPPMARRRRAQFTR